MTIHNLLLSFRSGKSCVSVHTNEKIAMDTLKRCQSEIPDRELKKITIHPMMAIYGNVGGTIRFMIDNPNKFRGLEIDDIHVDDEVSKETVNMLITRIKK